MSNNHDFLKLLNIKLVLTYLKVVSFDKISTSVPYIYKKVKYLKQEI